MVRTSGPKKHPQDSTFVDCLNNEIHGEDEDDNYYHWRANEILQQAAEHIRFFVNDNNRDQGGSLKRGGFTRPREGPITPAQAAKFELSGLNACGSGSDIHIGSLMYRQLKDIATLVDNHSNGENLSDALAKNRICSQFEIARLVVHELSHALEHLYTGWRRLECFCEGNSLSERGFDMEFAIFGGLLDIVWSRSLLAARKEEFCFAGKQRAVPSPCVVFYPWPNQVYADMYRWRKLKMGIMPVGEPRSSLAWRVPLSSVEKLFTTTYWETVSSSGQQSLNIRCVEVPWKMQWFAAQKKDRETIRPYLKRPVAATLVQTIAKM